MHDIWQRLNLRIIIKPRHISQMLLHSFHYLLPTKTHSPLSLTPSIISFPLKSCNIALHLSQIFDTASTSLLHDISYFFLSLIFEMRRSKMVNSSETSFHQSIGEAVRIVYSSEREKFDQRSHLLLKLELLFQFVLNY